MKRYIIGYKHKGKIYAVATHLGGVYISESEINVYYSKVTLLKDFEKAKRYVNGKEFWGSTNMSVKPEYRGGKLFISNIRSQRCEFFITGKMKISNDTQVSLRNKYRIKKDANTEN